MLLKMLLQSVFICCLVLFGVARADAADLANENRAKRSLDFGVFLKNLLQKSADLSNNAPPPRAPMRPITTPTPTTTTTTTTTAAPMMAPMLPPMMAQPFLQKSFYKIIPGVGRVGFGFGFAGNLGNQPFFYPIDQRGGYIDFDYNDDTMNTTAAPTTTSTTAASTTTSKTTTTTEAPMMSTQRPRPMQNVQRRPVLLPNAPQPGTRVVYQYVPAPYYNTQTPAPRIQHNFANAPINYDYYDPYSAPQRGQPPSYDYPAFYKARQIPTATQPRPAPVPATSPRPIIITPISAINGRAQLSDNLIYQYTPNDDIYSKEGASNADTEGDAVRIDDTSNPAAAITGITGKSDNVNDGAAVAADDYNDDSGNFDSADANTASPNAVADSVANNDDVDNDATTDSPSAQQNDANIDYADNSAPSDISGPLTIQLNTQNYGSDYDANENEVPYSFKRSSQKQGLFVYRNQPPKGSSSSYGAHPLAVNPQSSIASMRFRSPFASFHTTTVTNGHSYNRGQQFQRY